MQILQFLRCVRIGRYLDRRLKNMGLQRKILNLPILLAIVLGDMIGTGVYTLPASLARYGSVSLFAWVYTTIGALFLAFTFVYLNRQFPQTGGPYAFCKHAFGNATGFTVALIYWVSNLVSIAGLTVAAVGYLGFFIPALDSNQQAYDERCVLISELAIVWLFAVINIIGIKLAGKIQLVLTIIKILPVLAIIIFGFTKIDLNNFHPFVASDQTYFTAFTGSAALMFWAYIGIEAATVPSESSTGTNDIFKATIWGTIITSSLYIVSSFVIMGIMPMQALSGSQHPFADIGSLLFSTKGAAIITLCAFLSGLGTVNVCTLVQGQIVFAAARDDLFPKFLSKLSNNVPVRAQLLSALLISLLVFMTLSKQILNQIENIILLASLLTLITYAVSAMAGMKVAINTKTKKSIYNKTFCLTSLAMLYCIWMIMSIKPTILIIGLFIVLGCLLCYKPSKK